MLLVHNQYRTPGGEERHVGLLERALREEGLEVASLKVVSPAAPSRFERLRLGCALTYRPAGARMLRDAIAQARPDVVHFHNLFPLLTPAAVREAHACSVSTVLTIHNYRFACPSGTLSRNGRIHEDCIEGSSLLCGLRNSRGVWPESVAYGIAIELQRRFRMLHRWVDAYVAPSRFVARMLERAGYPSERVHVIYHSTPLDAGPSDVGGFAFYAGRLSSEKGVRTLLEASERAPRVPVRIAGEGPLVDVVRRAESDHVSYLGHIDDVTVARLRREALVTMAPSECYEGQPLGVLESMAAGTPVIASKLGGLAEIVQDAETGVLVPAGDADGFARAMEGMLDDRLRTAEMGTKAWEFARGHFVPEAQIGRLVELYESLVAARADGVAAEFTSRP